MRHSLVLFSTAGMDSEIELSWTCESVNTQNFQIHKLLWPQTKH